MLRRAVVHTMLLAGFATAAVPMLIQGVEARPLPVTTGAAIAGETPVTQIRSRRNAAIAGAVALGAIGATGTTAANHIAREADLVIGVGTRWSDFTTASKTAFQNPDVRFVNVNVADLDAVKHAGVGLIGDARATLEALRRGPRRLRG